MLNELREPENTGRLFNASEIVPEGEAASSASVDTVVSGVGLAEPSLMTREPVTMMS
ncbi:hypothetical protein ACFSLT_19240 [Novosphingobium resinovorum]